MRGNISWRVVCALSVAVAILGLLFTAGNARAATTLINDDFETGTLENWIPTAGGAGLYTYVSGTNYATSGTYALDVKKNSQATLTNPLPLDLLDFTSVTISFNDKWVNGSSTRRLYTRYSADGVGFTDLGAITSSSSSKSYTLNEGTHTFTDLAKFQFSFYDSGGADMHAYVDDIVISGTPDFSGYFWDVDGTVAGAGGAAPSGTWSAASENWNPEFAGTGTTAAWTPGSKAYFAAGTDATGTYEVTVDGTQEIGGLYFGAGTVTLAPAETTGGALSMTSDTAVKVGTGLTATVETAISDDGGAWQLTKGSTGTLILSGVNTYTGATTIDAGTIQFNSSTAMAGTGRDVTVNAAGMVAFGPSFGATDVQTALSNRIVAGSAGVIAADNQESTDFDFGAAGLTDARFGAVGNVTYTGTLTPGSAVYRLGGGGGTLTMASAITGDGNSLVVVGPGTVVLANANDYTGSTTVSAGGTLQIGDGGTTGSLNPSSAISVDGSLVFNRSDTITQGTDFSTAGITGNGSLTKLGEGTLILDAANDYAGTTTVNAGILQAGAGQTTAFGPAATAGLAFGPGSTGKVQLNGNSMTVIGLNTDATVGTPIVENGSTDTGAVLTVDATANSTYAGVLQDGNTGTLGLVKAGTGTMTLSGANTYTGGTVIDGGRLQFNAGAVPATGQITINSAGALLARGEYANAGAWLGSGKIAASSSGLLALTANNNAAANFTGFDNLYLGTTGKYTFGGYALTPGANGYLLGGGGGTLTLNGANTLGAGADLTVGGNVTISTANSSFDGAVTIDAGTLIINNATSLGSPSVIRINDGAKLQPAPGGLVIDAPITLGAGTATINGPTAGGTGGVVYEFTLNGSIGGDGNLVFNGSNGSNTYATIILGGQSTYGGSTLINCSARGANMFIKLATDDALPTTTVLTLDGGRGAGSGRTVYLDLNGYNQTLGGLTNVTRSARNQRVLNTTETAATLTVNNDSDNTFSGQLGTSIANGNFGLTKGGAGKLTLTKVNSYTGDTVINDGILSITTAYLADLADVYLTTGGIFDLNFTGADTIDELFFDGSGQADGTWGADGSLADHTSDFFTGDGLLSVTTSGGLDGDADGNGVVNAADYIIVKRNMGTSTGATLAMGNFDTDQDVDWADLQLLIDNFDAVSGGAPAVPEPATLFVLLAAGLPALLKRRRSPS